MKKTVNHIGDTAADSLEMSSDVTKSVSSEGDAPSAADAVTVNAGEAAAEAPKKKKKLTVVRAAVLAVLVFTLICGIIYPISVTLTTQVMFPFEANGSVITIVNPDGQEVTVGSELIGQQYEQPYYLFGRYNGGAPSNMSPESDEYKAEIEKRKNDYIAMVEGLGLVAGELGDVPGEILTSSGSGVDPHISPDTAYYQIPVIVAARNQAGWRLLTDSEGNVSVIDPATLDADGDEVVTAEEIAAYEATLDEGSSLGEYTYDFVKGIIDARTEGRWFGIFGEKHVNVLYVNLDLNGWIYNEK